MHGKVLPCLCENTEAMPGTEPLVLCPASPLIAQPPFLRQQRFAEGTDHEPMRCAEVTGVLQQKRVFHRIACRFSGTKKEKALSQCQKRGTGLWCEPVCRDGFCFVLRWCGYIKVGCRLHLKTVHCSARFRNHTLIGTILCVRHNFSLLLFDLCFGVLLIV